ncbi:MAG: GTP cyclohydrolase I FolE [Candidatus Thermoplasmatota archaeon]|nr:GTP cyclohydrolase I FolE [Candidatus Thermoplasmatota archaeon]
MDRDKIKSAVELFIEGIGEDKDREGLKDTPERIANMCEEILYGAGKDPKQELSVYFNEDHEELVLVRNISFFSMCEHHMLPFFGKANVAYIPKKGKLTGISKIARVVDISSRKLQLQERMTSEVADSIYEVLEPHGVAVVIKAQHLCMMMRGIKKEDSFVITSAIRGLFHKSASSRNEILSLLRD